MLRKLIKYDFLWMNRNMVIIFTITVILSIFTRIASNYTGSIMGDLIFGILRGFTIAAFANTVIDSVIRIWERFRQSLYKDESYLIHTLPVSKKKLYDSKTISGIGAILLSLVVVITCFFIAFWDNDIYEYFRAIFKDGDMAFILLGILVTAILEAVYAVNVGIFSLVVGHRFNNAYDLGIRILRPSKGALCFLMTHYSQTSRITTRNGAEVPLTASITLEQVSVR